MTTSNENPHTHSNDTLKYEHPPRPWYTRVPFASRKDLSLRNKHVDVDKPSMIPEASANFFSLLTFGWMSDILSLGYARPLDIPDLYSLQDNRSASYISGLIDESFSRRRKIAEEYNERLARGEVGPGWRSIWWTIRGNRSEREKYWRSTGGKKQPSLTFALNDSVKWWFWSAGLLRVTSDVLIITSPLVVQAIIDFATATYNAKSKGTAPPPISHGIAMALGLFLMQLVASLCTHHYWYRATSTGVLLRGGLVASIYSRAFHLSSRARVTLPTGQLVSHIAADVSRIDTNASLAHTAWSSLIQILISLIILLVTLGPSALAGFSLLLMGMPIQSWIMKRSYAARSHSMRYTDKRVKLTQDLLNGIRVLKFFAWEIPFLKSLTEIRKNEMRYVRKLLMIRAGNMAVATSFPILATVLAFICYSLTGHLLNPGIIFTSLTLFQLLRTPMQLLPVAFSGITDAYNAISRLYFVFIAETATDERIIDPTADLSVEVNGANFTWEGPAPSSDAEKKSSRRLFKRKAPKAQDVDPKHEDSSSVFKVEDINLSIPRGQLCAIVGPVGSGKSSLLQGLIGEMRKTSGTIKIGGTVSYCPQSAWIQNSTVRENICFGKPFDKERYWKAVRDSCLEADLALLPHGDMTEIGEKGVSLSGGQKQRLNICRSIYADTDVQIFDDPLSALDAHVGKEVFLNVLKSKSQKTTRILVTHALHFLPHVDYIITINQGRIVERGTYAELISNQEGAFAKFIKEFELDKSKDEEEEDIEEVEAELADEKAVTKVPSTPAAAALMQEEERLVGSVSNDVYLSYFQAARGSVLVPLILASLVLFQALNVLSSYWLIYWQEMKWPETQGFYIGVYSGLGIAQAVVSFILGSLFAAQSYFASRELHRSSINRVMHAPTSFFETTPLGRIMNRFSKDIDAVDNFLGEAWSTFANSISSIMGAIVLISAIFSWFLIPVAVIFVLYYYYSLYYRASAREINRMNSLLRSKLVTHFSESLSGLTTIRAYGEFDRFRVENAKRADGENRAYWLTVANGRWLAIRLDAFGISLIGVVALVAVLGGRLITPNIAGIMLTYILLIQSSLSLVVRQGAQVEILMNSVERVVHYAKHIEQEAYKGDKDSQPQASWPSAGQIEFKDLQLSYRPGLPPVLKGLNIKIAAGEKLGIVGRTGAGKSSIMVALYRLVEASGGSINIDNVDISKLDLETLRRSISIIPQEAILFPGTIRSNLDPFGQHDDAQLWDALKRAHLLDDKAASEKKRLEMEGTQVIPPPRFALDTTIDNDGSNFSMGERSLISLARALVKKSRVLVLDEATASVDYETDKKIQDTISQEFCDQTILCIAHRLNTIIGYDRVCVMDAGRVAELDTPANLFKQSGIFRSMCEQSGISLADILFAQKAQDN